MRARQKQHRIRRAITIGHTQRVQRHFIDDKHDLRDHIQRVLERNPSLFNSLVDIEMHDDAVVLTGTVRSYYQKQLAQESVRSIAGVKQIRNELQVVS